MLGLYGAAQVLQQCIIGLDPNAAGFTAGRLEAGRVVDDEDAAARASARRRHDIDDAA